MSPGLRVRLTALYGGIFAVFVAILMAVSYALMRGHLDRTLPPADASAALSQLGTQYAIAFAGAILIATALGWALAGASSPRPSRPSRRASDSPPTRATSSAAR